MWAALARRLLDADCRRATAQSFALEVRPSIANGRFEAISRADVQRRGARIVRGEPMTTTTAGTLEPPPSKPAHQARSGPGRWWRRLRHLGSLIKETAIQWDEDQAARQAA